MATTQAPRPAPDNGGGAALPSAPGGGGPVLLGSLFSGSGRPQQALPPPPSPSSPPPPPPPPPPAANGRGSNGDSRGSDSSDGLCDSPHLLPPPGFSEKGELDDEADTWRPGVKLFPVLPYVEGVEQAATRDASTAVATLHAGKRSLRGCSGGGGGGVGGGASSVQPHLIKKYLRNLPATSHKARPLTTVVSKANNGVPQMHRVAAGRRRSNKPPAAAAVTTTAVAASASAATAVAASVMLPPLSRGGGGRSRGGGGGGGVSRGGGGYGREEDEDGFVLLQQRLVEMLGWGCVKYGCLEASWAAAAGYLAKHRTDDAVDAMRVVGLDALARCVAETGHLKQPCSRRCSAAAVLADQVFTAAILAYPSLRELVARVRSQLYGAVFFVSLDASGTTAVPCGGCPQLPPQLLSSEAEYQNLLARYADRKTYFQACRMLTQLMTDKEALGIFNRHEGCMERVVAYWKGQVVRCCFRGWRAVSRTGAASNELFALQERVSELQAERAGLEGEVRTLGARCRQAEAALGAQSERQMQETLHERTEKMRCRAQLAELQAEAEQAAAQHGAHEAALRAEQDVLRERAAAAGARRRAGCGAFEVRNRASVLPLVRRELARLRSATTTPTTTTTDDSGGPAAAVAVEGFLTSWVKAMASTSPACDPNDALPTLEEGGPGCLRAFWLLLSRVSPRHVRPADIEPSLLPVASAEEASLQRPPPMPLEDEEALLLLRARGMGVHVSVPRGGLVAEGHAVYRVSFAAFLFVRFSGWTASPVAYGDEEEEEEEGGGEGGVEETDAAREAWDDAADAVSRCCLWRRVDEGLRVDAEEAWAKGAFKRLGEAGGGSGKGESAAAAAAAAGFAERVQPLLARHQEALREVFCWYAAAGARSSGGSSSSGCRVLSPQATIRLLRDARIVSCASAEGFSLTHLRRYAYLDSYFADDDDGGGGGGGSSGSVTPDNLYSILAAVACLNPAHPSARVDAAAPSDGDEPGAAADVFTPSMDDREVRFGRLLQRVCTRCRRRPPAAAAAEPSSPEEAAAAFCAGHVYAAGPARVLACHEAALRRLFDSCAAETAKACVPLARFHTLCAELDLRGLSRGEVDEVAAGVLGDEVEGVGAAAGGAGGGGGPAFLYHEFVEALCAVCAVVSASNPFTPFSTKLSRFLEDTLEPLAASQ